MMTRSSAYGFRTTVFQVADAEENLHNDDEYTRYLAGKGELDEYRKIQAKHADACGPIPSAKRNVRTAFIGRRGCEFVDGYREDRPFLPEISPLLEPHPPYWHPGDLQHEPEDMPEPIGVGRQRPDPGAAGTLHGTNAVLSIAPSVAWSNPSRREGFWKIR